ncbi:MAG: hypothetical protein OEY38_20440 [Gammaproteobacteria bacterium]|nr:hypothetical protein [Gammaproteobacteria bacterium]
MVIITLAFGAFIQWLLPSSLDRGWTYFVFGHSSNVTLTPITTLSPGIVDFKVALVLLIFLFLFMIIMPFVVHLEERFFRYHILSNKEILLSATLFGATHIIIGISLIWCIAIILPGLFFGYRYRSKYVELSSANYRAGDPHKAALVYSAQYHTAFNTIVLSLLVLMMTAGTLVTGHQF